MNTIKRGIATFTLDEGRCPKWLFERMVKLGREILCLIIQDQGPDEFLKRIADPVWFQALGTALAFDWNASGLTTVLTAALKEALRGLEKDLGIFICGGKGKTSLKTPDEIKIWGARIGFDEAKAKSLVYFSKMSAKIDNSLVQDGYQIYHHAFLFSKTGAWTVVQQGMNMKNATARRYHWFSPNIKSLVCEPHSGVASQIKAPTMNLVASESEKARQMSKDLVCGSYNALMKDIQLLRKHFTPASQMISLKTKTHQLTLLNLEDNEKDFEVKHHPLIHEDFSKSKYLERILYLACGIKPKTYEELVALKGVGPKTIRSLALVGELIYGAKISFKDPARYSFAFGGKDRIPFPIDRKTYDNSIEIIKRAILRSKLGINEKNNLLARVSPLLTRVSPL